MMDHEYKLQTLMVALAEWRENHKESADHLRWGPGAAEEDLAGAYDAYVKAMEERQ